MGRSPTPPTRPEVELDLGRYELRVNGRRAHLERLPMELLILLRERQPQLVTRDEIVGRLWGEGVHLDAEQGINSAIRKIRRALKDDPERLQHVETVVGKGYRLISPFRVVPKTAEAEIRSGEEGTYQSGESKPGDSRGRWLFGVGVAIVLLGLVGAGMEGWETRRPITGTAPIRSVAVLPLQDLSAGPIQEYFVDGMTDELITDLAQIGSLSVISRTSIMQYKGKSEPASEIGRELNVDALVEGTVVRLGNRVRITAQLIDARTDRHLWARTYERDATDILALEDEVTESIATEIGARLSAKETGLLAEAPKVDPRAYDAYLQGIFLKENDRNRRGAKQSLRYELQAVSIDPRFALGYAGVAKSYLFLNGFEATAELMPKARAAAQRAIELDPGLGAAHTALGKIFLTYDYDWARAEGELRKGVELGPNDPEAHNGYAQYLMAKGKLDEAIAEMLQTQKLNPLAMTSSRGLGRAYYYARRYDEAIAQLGKARELGTENTSVDNWLGWAYEKKGMEREAAESLINSFSENGASPEAVRALRKAAAAGGVHGFAREALRLIGPRAATAGGYAVALLYVESGDRDHAIECLERAFQKHSVWSTWVAVDPELDPLRGEPRFQRLLQRMGLSL